MALQDSSNNNNNNNNNKAIELSDDDSPPLRMEKCDDDEICELEHLRKLFIGGIAPYTTEEGLKEYYGQWGKVVDVVVMRDPQTKRSRGFGFITFTKSSMVDKAQENRPHIIDGKAVEAKRALPRPERESRETNISVKKLFVGGLKDNHDEACLQEYFSQFGKVISIKILTDKTTGKRRGFAFVEYDDYDAVDKAILQKSHSIKYVVVDVKKSIYNYEQQKHFATTANNSVQSKPPIKDAGNAPTQPNSYRPQPPQNAPNYQQPPPMHSGPPPPNYYWGPPPAMPHQYGGYQQPPNPPMNNWGYPPTQQNGWNGGPPPVGPPPNWYPNQQWGTQQGPPPGPPPTGPANVTQAPSSANWNMPPGTAPPVPPPGPPNSAPPQQQPPPNFGTGYQQSYAGGPAKHNLNSNRMNPYSAPPTNNYGNSMQSSSSNYGNYNMQNGNSSTPTNNNKPITNGTSTSSSASKYRR